MKQLQTFEDYLVNKVINIFCYVRTRRYKEDINIKKLVSMNLTLVEFDVSDFVIDKPKLFFDLMTLCITGKISYEEEKMDFSSYLDKEDRNTLLETIFFIVVASLIAIEFKETNNLYKAILNNELNSKYIIDNIKNIIADYIDEDYDVDNKFFNFFKKESKEFYQIIINSGVLVK